MSYVLSPLSRTVIDVCVLSVPFYPFLVGLDFYLNVSNITFEPGVTSLFLPVVAVSDGLYEGEDESIILIGRPGDGETRVRVNRRSEQATFALTDTDSKSIG